MATMIYSGGGKPMIARMVAMTTPMDDGDDLIPLHTRADDQRARDRGSLKRIHRARGVQNENLEEHEREPRGGKITHSELHRHAVTRVDAHFDMQVLAATKRELPKMEYLCFIGMEFGMVEDDKGVLRWHPGKREPVDRDLTFREVGRHYGLSEETVQQYDRRARRVYGRHLRNAEYERGQSGDATG